MSGELVVYGARCAWWDYIENAGSILTRSGYRLPACPHCGSPLFQATDEDWRRGVSAHAQVESGYHDLIGFMKGKCFPSMVEARAAYAAERAR